MTSDATITPTLADSGLWVRHTSSDQFAAEEVTTLTIGDISKTFTSVTETDPALIEECLAIDSEVTVTCGPLMWENTTHVSEKDVNWQSAEAYCNSLVLDDFDDWRLPTFSWDEEHFELETIRLNDMEDGSSIVKPAFIEIMASEGLMFWTSASYSENSSDYAVAAMAWGPVDNADSMRVDQGISVRCVRDVE
jgi:hypothetical protein